MGASRRTIQEPTQNGANTNTNLEYRRHFTLFQSSKVCFVLLFVLGFLYPAISVGFDQFVHPECPVYLTAILWKEQAR